MDSIDTLRNLQIDNVDYQHIPHDILQRLSKMGARNPKVAFSCVHDPSQFVVYDGEHKGSWIASSVERLTYVPGSRTTPESFWIDVDDIDELPLENHRVYVTYESAARDKSLRELLLYFTRELLVRLVHRHRLIIRRIFIEAKVGSSDLGTFCYRLLNEYIGAAGLKFGAASIFVLDKSSGQIRLRSQYPRRDDRRFLADISVRPTSKSWIAQTYSSGLPTAEYGSELRAGRTRESDSIIYASRIYWPIQIQHRRKWTARQRAGDPTVGILRLSNAYDVTGDRARPFHCVDALSIEFIAESLYNIIGSYVDKDVEGFDRDLAFHAAKTPAVGCLRNLKLVGQLLFNPEEVPFLERREGAVPKQFDIRPTGVFGEQDLIRAMNNAYAFALNIAAQVERSNITEELFTAKPRVIEKLYSEVLWKSVNLLPYFQLSHSISHDLDGSKRLRLNKIFEGSLPPPVIGDVGSLTSVFNNVLENSVKYARRDSPLEVEITWSQDETHVTISVRDNGIGIPPDDATRIFTRGMRSERAKEHTVRGNGLGLAFCLRVMKSFGGDMEAVPLDSGMIMKVKLRKAKVGGRGNG